MNKERQKTEEKLHPIVATIADLVASGAHFGHQTYRWNPKMRPYIFGSRNGLHLIDLAKTRRLLQEAASVLKQLVARRGTVLFVGTKKQAKEAVRDVAEKCGEFWVSWRWLGGLLTNFATVREAVKRWERIQKKLISGCEGFTKKEIALLEKEQAKLERNFVGIRTMRKLPSILVVVGATHEHLAVAEAVRLGIPVMAIVDTNDDPSSVDYCIPANDDASKSIGLILRELGDAITAGKATLSTGVARGGVSLAAKFDPDGANKNEEDSNRD